MADSLQEQLTARGLEVTHNSAETVVVERDSDVMSFSGIEALAGRAGYFVFASDAAELTLQSYESCPWKEQIGGVTPPPPEL